MPDARPAREQAQQRFVDERQVDGQEQGPAPVAPRAQRLTPRRQRGERSPARRVLPHRGQAGDARADLEHRPVAHRGEHPGGARREALAPVDHLGLGDAQAAGCAAGEQQPGRRPRVGGAGESIRRHRQTVLSRGRRGPDQGFRPPRQTSGRSRT